MTGFDCHSLIYSYLFYTRIKKTKLRPALPEGTAPRGWHLKEQMRKELKSMVRQIVFVAKIPNWKDLPSRIEEYALNHYVA